MIVRSILTVVQTVKTVKVNISARTAISFAMCSAQIVAVRVSITLYLDAYALLVKLM